MAKRQPGRGVLRLTCVAAFAAAAVAACARDRDGTFSVVGSWVNDEKADGLVRYWDFRADGACTRIHVDGSGAIKACDVGNCQVEQGKLTRTVIQPSGASATQRTTIDSPKEDVLRFLPDLDNALRLYRRRTAEEGALPGGGKCP
jgi:hypothetical protein